MDQATLLSVPAGALRQIELFGEVIRRFAPDADDGATVEQLLAGDGSGAFADALSEAAAAFDRENLREVREFGVDLDPQGLRYRWGSPEIDEAVVSLIERSEAPIEEGRIVFYGPSNICFWYSLERDMLPYKAYNHGIGGCIDEDMIRFAPRLLYPYRPRVVFFQTGSNDIASGIPLETILANKRRMYNLFLTEMPQAKLVICSGLPLPGRTQFWDATGKTNALLREMCASEERLVFMDATDAMLTDSGPDSLRTADGRYFNPAFYRIDRIHLNKRGHDVWTGLMKKTLRDLGIQP